MPQEWENNNLFNCMPCGLCLKTSFCPCVTVGQTHAYIKHNEQNPDVCSGWCWGWCGLNCCGLGFILQMIDRGDLRAKHDLQGSSFGACCAAFWCCCCEAIQTNKEAEYQLVEGGGKKAPTGYATHEKMVATPQGGPVPQQQYQHQ